MKEKNILFSKKLRGYDRKAVNNYIAETNRVFTEKESDLNGELSRLKDENAKISNELHNVQKSVSYVCSIIDSENALLEEKNGTIDKLSSQLNELRSSSEIELREKNAIIGQLQDQKVSDRVSYEAEIAKLREECREKLIENATEVERIREEYRLKGEAQYSMVEAAAYKMRDHMAAELRSITKDCLREILSCIEEIKSDSDTVAQNANGSYVRMNEHIEKYETRMKDEVRRILDEFKNCGFSGENE